MDETTISYTPNKEIIARRIARMFHTGNVVNLGIGLPTMVEKYLPADLEILLQLQHQILTLRAEVDRLTSVVAVNQPNLRLAAESTQ